MLDKKVFKDKMEQLIRFYPSWNLKIEDSKVMSDWYEMFKDKTNDQFETMVKHHIKTVPFNPTVASLSDCNSNTNEKVIDGVRYIGGLKVYE